MQVLLNNFRLLRQLRQELAELHVKQGELHIMQLLTVRFNN
jgi:hypothetical protein